MKRKEEVRKETEEKEGTKGRTMNRKEAIRKTGYIALSATTMMMLLSKPDKAVAGSGGDAPRNMPGKYNGS